MMAATTLAIAVLGPAAPAQAADLGTPGEGSCSGQTLAWRAQQERAYTTNYDGLAGYLRYQREFGLDWTMQHVKAETSWWCSGAGL
jgi:hypothetical protein